jgi:hypothetical protein
MREDLGEGLAKFILEFSQLAKRKFIPEAHVNAESNILGMSTCPPSYYGI